MSKSRRPRNDFDGAWKAAIRAHFQEFLEFYFPLIHADIDWKVTPRFLDKELKYVIRKVGQGRREADVLVMLTRKNQGLAVVNLHVEIQSQPDQNFQRRMFVYSYLIQAMDPSADIVSLAILSDRQADWKPTSYRWHMWGCHKFLNFPVRKLLDFEGFDPTGSLNPFAWITAAHLRALKAPSDSAARCRDKIELVKALYRCNFTPDLMGSIFLLLDHLLVLDSKLGYSFTQEMVKFEESLNMEKRMVFSFEEIIRKQVTRRVRRELREVVREEVRKEVAKEVREEVAKEVREEVAKEVRDEVAKEVRDEVAKEVRDEVAKEVREEVAKEVRDEVREAAKLEIAQRLHEAGESTERIAHTVGLPLNIVTAALRKKS